MNEIRPIGTYLPTDPAGYLRSPTSLAGLQPHWRTLAEGMRDLYRDHFGENLHSVYVRGTVAKGVAIDHVSDIDTFALIHEGENETQPEWSREARARLLAAHAFSTGIECIVLPLAKLKHIKPPKTRNAWERLIKTQSVCLYGEDLAPKIAPFRPGLEMVSHIFDLRADLPSEEDLGQVTEGKCTWLMKRIVRSGFELVMERSRNFTRDLYPCYETFSRYYPEREPEMRKALELAVFPVATAAPIRELSQNLGQWLATQGEEWKARL